MNIYQYLGCSLVSSDWDPEKRGMAPQMYIQVRGTSSIVKQSMNEEKREEESGSDESDGMTTSNTFKQF